MNVKYIPIVLLICIAFCVALGSLSGITSEGLSAVQAVYDAKTTEAEAKLSLAIANETAAQAELVKARAQEFDAKADLALKAGQAEALNTAAGAAADTVDTANDIVERYSIIYPVSPPIYIALGFLFGVCAAGGIAYIIGHKHGMKETHLRESTSQTCESRSQIIPVPEVIGG